MPRWQRECHPPSKGLRVSGLGSRVCVGRVAAEIIEPQWGSYGIIGFCEELTRLSMVMTGSLGVDVRVSSLDVWLGESSSYPETRRIRLGL